MQLASMTDAAVVGNDLWILGEEDIGMNMSGGVGLNLFEIYLGKLSSIYSVIVPLIGLILLPIICRSKFDIFNISTFSTFSKPRKVENEILSFHTDYGAKLPARS